MNDGGPAPAAAGGVPPRLAAALAAIRARTGCALAASAARGTGRDADRRAAAAAARAALEVLGVPTAPDDPGLAGHHDDGRPCWPAGATGSRAHAAGIAVAVATRRPDGVVTDARCWTGIDVEVAGALPAADAVAVLATAEQAAVAAHDAPDHEATRIWSAKEAAFKAWCEATDGGLGTVDPVDLLVVLGAADDDGLRPVTVRATGRLAAPTAAIGPLTGWCADTGDHVVVLVCSTRAALADHHGVDGIASAAITTPSAANATT